LLPNGANIQKMEVVCQEKTHKIWERPPHTFERRSGYKLGKEGVLEAEKRIYDDYQPTSHCWESYSGIEDYELKASITTKLRRLVFRLRLISFKKMGSH
jgi:hypothetical protein